MRAEESLDGCSRVARQKMKTKAFAESRDERNRVEMRFAHLKLHHGFDRQTPVSGRQTTNRTPDTAA
jgi:hypothetical protein